ncbi:MAG TPA: ribbon-helix-helix domain-containing protein [Jatrophihabitans sp.]|nr:ribbon-helix-helix domain-containing protein [Jatrophihabitans sp.]
MKLSISVSDADVAALDAYMREAGLRSRSAAIQHAIKLLRQNHLDDEYAAAWDEWESSADRDAWERTASDGLNSAAR